MGDYGKPQDTRWNQESWGKWENVVNQDISNNPRYQTRHEWHSPSSWWNVPGPHAGKGPKNYQRSDDAILRDVSARLAAHGQLDAHDIDVGVENGEVTLAGRVNNRQDKRLTEDIAESVAGVVDVHNRLRIHASQPKSRQVADMFPLNLFLGERVVGSMGGEIGTIKDIHDDDFVINRVNASQVHVPYTAILDTTDDQVRLNITANQIDRQNWQHIE